MEHHIYDMIVIGGGPGGYTAALYAVRAGFDTLILEKLAAGGQMALTHQIENYPGFEHGIDGISLAEKMQKQAEHFGVRSKYAEVVRVNLNDCIKVVETREESFQGKTVVFATGAIPRKLGLAKEPMLLGKGISYCASCDGMFYKGKTVVVVGGGNTAVGEALLLCRIAKKVIVVARRNFFRATKMDCVRLESTENIEVLWNCRVTEFLHGEKLTGVRLSHVSTGEECVVACDGVFICIGRTPESFLVQGQLELDKNGYVIAGETTKTNIPGVYAVGDVRTKPLRQIVTAVADGSVAVRMAEEYLSEYVERNATVGL